MPKKRLQDLASRFKSNNNRNTGGSGGGNGGVGERRGLLDGDEEQEVSFLHEMSTMKKQD